MSEENIYHDEIDKYLMGQMGTFELGLFEHKMAQDDELKYEVEIRRKAIEMLEWQRAAELKEFIRKNTPHKRQMTFWQQVFVYSSVACTLFFVLSWALITLYFPENHISMLEGNSSKTKTEENQNHPTDEKKNPAFPSEQQNAEIPQSSNNTIISSDSEGLILDENKQEDLVAGESMNDDAKAQPSAVESDAFAIKSDELVLDTNFYASNFRMAMNDNEVVSSTSKSESTKTPAAPASKTRKALTVDTLPSFSKLSNINLKVEFWRSPINYRGYKYNGLKLQLYGMNQPSKIKFRVLNDELYMSTGDQVFHLVKEDRYNSYWPETDKAILKLFK